MPWPEIAGDPRFFARTGPHPLATVAEVAGGRIATQSGCEAAGETKLLLGVAPLQTAGPEQVSFLDNRRYAAMLETTSAGAVIVHPDLAPRLRAHSLGIIMSEPYVGWARVAALFYPEPPPRPGAHPSAVIDPAASIDPSAEIGPLAVIAAGAEVGPRSRIGAGAAIGPGVVIGPDCRIGAQATVSHALIGARVYVYPGARIGQEGFGFATTSRGFLTVPQLGRVILEDDVEVGANATIDRGSAHDTVIGAGSRLDNLVQIGHNVRTGRCCVIVSQAGISGSTVLGDHVMVAGQAGLVGHLRIGGKARIGAQAGVMSDVPAAADVVGSPAQPVREFFRQVAALKRLARGVSGRGRRAGGRVEGEPAAPPEDRPAGEQSVD